VLVLPAASETVMVTTTVPWPKGVSGAGLCTMLVTPMLSVTTRPSSGDAKFAIGAKQPVLALTDTGLAHDTIVGGVVSAAVTAVEHVLVLPDASVTVKVTVVVPAGITVPGAGACAIEVEQASVTTSWLRRSGRTPVLLAPTRIV